MRPIHLLQLQARPKYGASKNAIYQRVRCELRGDGDFFLHKVGQGSLIPPECKPQHLVLYSTTNPIDLVKSNLKVQHALLDQMDGPKKERPLSADRLWFHGAPTTCSDKKWLTFDVDLKKEVGKVVEILKRFDIPVDEAVETRGGYHLFVEQSHLKGKSTKAFIDALKEFTFTSPARDGKMITHQVSSFPRNTLCAVPGTLQGGFPVRLLTRSEIESLDS